MVTNWQYRLLESKMAINPEADLAHWLQIFGPGRYEGHHEESQLKKIKDVMQREEESNSQVRYQSQNLTFINPYP